MNPGIYKNVPFAEYQKWPACHKSMFTSILKSGLHLKHFLEKGEKETDIMIFGNLVDCLLFEPDRFKSRYVMAPATYPAVVKKVEVQKKWNWTANYCKEWREQKEEAEPDIKIITEADFCRASTITDRIKIHPEAGKWLQDAEYQVSIFWIDPETGLACKGRLDALQAERLSDLKITNNPHPSGFSKTAANFLYHVQGAFYHDGYMLAQGKTPGPAPELPFSFIVAEDQPPHDVVCYNLGPESFDAGRIVYREALNRYKEVVDTGDYSGYSNVAEELEIPHWALNKIMMEGIVE